MLSAANFPAKLTGTLLALCRWSFSRSFGGIRRGMCSLRWEKNKPYQEDQVRELIKHTRPRKGIAPSASLATRQPGLHSETLSQKSKKGDGWEKKRKKEDDTSEMEWPHHPVTWPPVMGAKRLTGKNWLISVLPPLTTWLTWVSLLSSASLSRLGFCPLPLHPHGTPLASKSQPPDRVQTCGSAAAPTEDAASFSFPAGFQQGSWPNSGISWHPLFASLLASRLASSTWGRPLWTCTRLQPHMLI